MMNGIKNNQCQNCHHQNLGNYKNFYNNIFYNKIDEIFQKTNENGFTEMLPISFDYRISNLCNFKCRTCSDVFSSSLENENRQRNKIFFIFRKNKEKNEFYHNNLKNELLNAIQNETIEEIYWVGGEPLLWSFHWDVMNQLIEKGLSSKILIRYNTNLSIIKYKKYYLYDILKNFKNVSVYASLDGTDQIREYIRDGLKFNNWMNNFKEGLKYREILGDFLMIDFTVTLPGLLSVKQMIDLSAEFNVSTNLKTIIFDPNNLILYPLSLPKNILHPILDDIIKYAQNKSRINKKIFQFINFFIDLKNKVH